LGKTSGREIAREGVNAQDSKPRAFLGGFPCVNAAKVAAIGKTEDTFVQFEGYIHVHSIFTFVGDLQQFFAIRKPEKLAIEAKMHSQQAAVQNKKNIFTFAIDNANASALGMTGDMRNGLRLCGDGMENVNAADSPTLDEGT